MRKLEAVVNAWIDFIMPEHLTCYFCDAEMPPTHGKPLCHTCDQALIQIEGNLCKVCGRVIDHNYAQHADYYYKCKECQEQFAYYETHRAYTHYEGGVKKALIGLKYKRQIHQAVLLGGRLGEMVQLRPELMDFDHIVPVPVHMNRRITRGYNQAEELASEMAKVIGVAPPKEWLRRKRKTKKLKNLGRASRKDMLSGAIMIKSGVLPLVKEKKILLVDDIYTTGATLNACAKALYEAGCAKVICVTVARGR